MLHTMVAGAARGRSIRALGQRGKVGVSFSDARVRIALGLVTLAALASYWYGPTVGVVTTAAFLFGWWAWFDGVRVVALLVRGSRPDRYQSIRGALGVIGCATICATGFSPVVALVVACYVVIDGFAFNFKG